MLGCDLKALRGAAFEKDMWQFSETGTVSFRSWITWMKLRCLEKETSVNPHHVFTCFLQLADALTQDSSSEFSDQIHTSDELRYAMARWTKTRAASEISALRLRLTQIPWSDMTPWPQEAGHLPEISRRKLETFRFAPLTRTWGKRRRAGSVACHKLWDRCETECYEFKDGVGKPAHDNLKLVNTLLLKMGTNMNKLHQVSSSYLRNRTFALARLK